MKIETKKLQKMIQEAIQSYIKEWEEMSEADIRQRMAAKTSGGGADMVNIDKLMMALDAAEKQGKTGLTASELSSLAKQAIEVAAPLGKGNAQQLAAKAASKTGGAPVAPPSNMMMEENEGKISLTKAQLKEMVISLLENNLLGKKNPIMAKREIIAMMDSTSRNFEREIVKTFNLRDPDELTPELQRKYLEIVEGMKSELVAAAMKAVQQLINFPTNDGSK